MRRSGWVIGGALGVACAPENVEGPGPAATAPCEELSAGPFTPHTLEGVTSTEDLAFDGQGRLLTADRDRNLRGWHRNGTFDLVGVAVGETRGLAILPDGDPVFTNPDTGEVVRVSLETGGASLHALARIGVSLMDVTADGDVALGDLNGHVSVVAADGGVTSWGRLATQLYGTTFSTDESRLWFASYSPADQRILVSDRGPDGAWPEPVPWTTVSARGLAGMTTDVCGNLYAVEANTCAVWRFDPDGVETLLVDLDLPRGACYSLGFGQGLGDWPATALYVSTYDAVVELELGVTGR